MFKLIARMLKHFEALSKTFKYSI